MEIGNAGGFECPYCKARFFMSDSEFRGNQLFQKKLASYYRTQADRKEMDYESDTFWEKRGTAEYTTETGKQMIIGYMTETEYRDFVCYLAKESIVYVFDNERKAERFLVGLKMMDLPEADTKLERCFPKLKMSVELQKGRALVFRRPPGFYPVRLFAPLPSEHLAWVISRMENFCCALEYSGIRHGNIDTYSVYINPKTHEGMLFGDWGKTENKKSDEDLLSVRSVAVEIAADNENPRQLCEFLNSKPKEDAFRDFEYWDTVIEEGFGGHRFVKM